MNGLVLMIRNRYHYSVDGLPRFSGIFAAGI